MFSNDKTFFVPIGNAWLLAVLNAPLTWWHNWRYMGHMKDEALNPAAWRMEKLPIARPSDEVRAEAEEAVGCLVSLARAEQEARRDTLDWLRVEFGVEKPGQKLGDFASLDADDFVEEVRKRRPKGAEPLTPAVLKALRSLATRRWRPRFAKGAPRRRTWNVGCRNSSTTRTALRPKKSI